MSVYTWIKGQRLYLSDKGRKEEMSRYNEEIILFLCAKLRHKDKMDHFLFYISREVVFTAG